MSFEPSMFLCPAVHMSTRNLLRFSSTHETSGRILSDVSSLLHHHRTGPIHFRRWRVGVRPLGRSRQDATRNTQGIASHRSRCRDRLQTSVISFELRGSDARHAKRVGSRGNQPSLNTRYPGTESLVACEARPLALRGGGSRPPPSTNTSGRPLPLCLPCRKWVICLPWM